MQATFTFTADSTSHAREIGERLEGLIAIEHRGDRVEAGHFAELRGFGARIITTEPARVLADLEAEGFEV